MILTVTENTYELLEPDVYRVKLVEVQEIEGTYGMQVKLKLQVAEPDLEDVTVTAWANVSTAPQSKLVRWLGAFNGRPFSAGQKINVDALIGKTAKAVLDVKTSADGRQYNRVNDILPLRQKRQPEPEDEGDPFEEE